MDRLCWHCVVLIIFSVTLTCATPSNAQSPECPPGFHWDRLSGVGCVQTTCLDLSSAKYTYTSSCSCVEGYKGCYEPVDSSGIACIPFCPTSKLIACIAPDAACPGVDQPPGGENPEILVEESPIEPGEPDLPAISDADLVRFLETFLAGENAQVSSPGWMAIASLAAAVLLGIWILINLLPNLTLNDIRSTIGNRRTKDMISSLDSSTTPQIRKIYDSNPTHFRQCQDMVYARVWGQPPPHARGQTKGLIFEKMEAEGYWQADQGGI